MHFRRQRDALLTLQERKTGLALGGRLEGRAAGPTMDQFLAKLADLPKRVPLGYLRNGGEWAQHDRLRDELGVRTYFCDPHRP